MSFPVKPIGDIVFIAPEAAATAIEMIDPCSALRGRVLAIGPEAAEVRVGDMVRLAPGRTIEAVFDQKRVWVTREAELLAVEV